MSNFFDFLIACLICVTLSTMWSDFCKYSGDYSDDSSDEDDEDEGIAYSAVLTHTGQNCTLWELYKSVDEDGDMTKAELVCKSSGDRILLDDDNIEILHLEHGVHWEKIAVDAD